MVPSECARRAVMFPARSRRRYDGVRPRRRGLADASAADPSGSHSLGALRPSISKYDRPARHRPRRRPTPRQPSGCTAWLPAGRLAEEARLADPVHTEEREAPRRQIAAHLARPISAGADPCQPRIRAIESTRRAASRLALMAIRAGGEAEAPSSTCRRGPPNDALLLAPGAHRSEQSRSKRDAVRSHPQFARLVRESEGVGRGSVPCPHETTAFDAVAAERSARTARITPVRMRVLGNQKRRRPDAASSRRAAHRPDLNVEATLRRANRKAAQESSRSEANLTVRRSTARHHPGSNVVRPGAEDDAPLGHAACQIARPYKEARGISRRIDRPCFLRPGHPRSARVGGSRQRTKQSFHGDAAGIVDVVGLGHVGGPRNAVEPVPCEPFIEAHAPGRRPRSAAAWSCALTMAATARSPVRCLCGRDSPCRARNAPPPSRRRRAARE